MKSSSEAKPALRATSVRLSALRAWSTAVRAPSSAVTASLCRCAVASRPLAVPTAATHHTSAATSATAAVSSPTLTVRWVRRRSRSETSTIATSVARSSAPTANGIATPRS